jgi:hypothetical protein
MKIGLLAGFLQLFLIHLLHQSSFSTIKEKMGLATAQPIS